MLEFGSYECMYEREMLITINFSVSYSTLFHLFFFTFLFQPEGQKTQGAPGTGGPRNN